MARRRTSGFSSRSPTPTSRKGRSSTPSRAAFSRGSPSKSSPRAPRSPRRSRSARASSAPRRARSTPGTWSRCSAPTPKCRAARRRIAARPAGWLYELKLDGFRIIADKRGDDAALFFRKLGSANAALSGDRPRHARSPAQRVVLDGEVVAFDEQRAPELPAFAGAHAGVQTGGARVHRGPKSPVIYIVFDLLALGRSRPSPAAAARAQGASRRAAARQRAPSACSITSPTTGGRSIGSANGRNSKGWSPSGPLRRTSRDRSAPATGSRSSAIATTSSSSSDLPKVKGARKRLGALDLGAYEDGELVVRGKVGSGLDDRTIDELLARLAPLTIDHTTGARRPSSRRRAGARSSSPRSSSTCRFGRMDGRGTSAAPGVSRHSRRRQARGVHGRSASVDRRSNEARRDERDGAPTERATPTSGGEPMAQRGRSTGQRRRSDATRRAARASPITNPKKIFWPDDKLTKKDLCDYYMAVAPALLALPARSPGGPRALPRRHRRQELLPMERAAGHAELGEDGHHRRDEDGGSRVTCFLVNDADTLLYIANLGCIPDPHAGRALGHRSRCATSSPSISTSARRPSPTPSSSRSRCAIFSTSSVSSAIRRPRANRASRAGADGPRRLLRDREGARRLIGRLLERGTPRSAPWSAASTSAASACTSTPGKPGARAPSSRPIRCAPTKGATVSTPLDWDEVNATLTPTRWSMLSVPARIEERGDPMRQSRWPERPRRGARGGATRNDGEGRRAARVSSRSPRMPAFDRYVGLQLQGMEAELLPDGSPDARFLSYYATRLNGVEIDSTFYRMPTDEGARRLAGRDPEHFRFAIKANQKITHRERLVVPSESLGYLLKPCLASANASASCSTNSAHLQTRPRPPRELSRRAPAFAAQRLRVPPCVVVRRRDLRAAREAFGVALCINDNDEFECPVKITAKHTYIRLRRDGYTPEQRATLERAHRRACRATASTCSRSSSTRTTPTRRSSRSISHKASCRRGAQSRSTHVSSRACARQTRALSRGTRAVRRRLVQSSYGDNTSRLPRVTLAYTLVARGRRRPCFDA